MKGWLKGIDRVEVLPRPGGIDLRYSEWTRALPANLFKKFINTLTWDDFALYPDTNLLKDKIAKHYNVTPINVYLAPGSTEAIKSVFDCLDLGESVLTTDPCFPMYDVYAKQNFLDINRVLPTTDLTYNVKDFHDAQLIVISRPSSPIGYFFNRASVIEILKNNPTSWVLIDEAYIDYVENKDSIVDLIYEYDNLIISRSFSKSFGAAGCRVGYLLSNSTVIDTVSKFRQMYELSGASMRYAMFLLDNQDEIDAYCKKTIAERKKLCKLFNANDIETLSSEGNWIHSQQTAELLIFMRELDINVKQGITIPTQHGLWVRITVGPGVSKLFKKLF